MLQGTPSEAGDFELAFERWSGEELLDQGSGLLTVLPKSPQVALGPVVFQSWLGEETRLMIPHSGGKEPVEIISQGELPAGLTLEDNHLVGVPREVGVFEITLVATDAQNTSDAKTLLIRIGPRF